MADEILPEFEAKSGVLLRDAEERELYAYPTGADVNWYLANGINVNQANFIQTGVPAKPGLLSMRLNPNLLKRRLFAYIWSKPLLDPAANFCFFLCQFTYYRGSKPVATFPLRYTLGKMPVQNILGKSLSNSVIGGGLGERNCHTLTLWFPNQPGVFAGAYDEPSGPVLLQPFETEFACDRIDLDVLGWANFDPGFFRVWYRSEAV